MAIPTDDQIGEDVRVTVEAIDGMVGCAYPPPENAPAQGPFAWVDLGPIDVQQGNLEIAQTQITITVVTPRKGDYPGEYRLVLAFARKVQQAFRQNIAIADDAIVMNPATISKPMAAKWGEQDPGNIVACQVTLLAQTMDETVNELEL